MNPFDQLTLGEVEEMTTVCFDGKEIQDLNPFTLAGGVMFMHQRREVPGIEWDEFKRNTLMVDIKEFAARMNEDEMDPTNGAILPTV